MRAALDDAPFTQHDDLVSTFDGRDAMRDENCRPLAHHIAEPAEDALFRVGVHARKRIIQNENFWLAQNRARKRSSLFLATG